MDTLPHLGPAVVNDHFMRPLNRDPNFRRLRHAVANACIFNPAGQASVSGFIKCILNRQQGCFSPGAPFDDLACGGHIPIIKRVVIAELPAIEAGLFAQIVNTTFQPKGGLVDPKAAHGPAGQIVGVNGRTDHIGHREIVRACGVPGRPLQHLHPHRGVGPRIADEPGFTESELARFVCADGIFHPDGVALGVHHDRFVPGQLHLDRHLEQMSEDRGLSLHRQVFLTAKSAPVRH